MYGLKDYDAALLELACIAEAFGTAYGMSVIEAAEALQRLADFDTICGMMQEILDLESEKAATIVLLKKCERREWREATRYACDRERTRAHAFRLTMKHHKAREVMRLRRHKKIYGGLM